MSHSNRSSIAAPFLAFIAGMAAWAFFGSKIREKVEDSEDWQELRTEIEDKFEQAQDKSRETYNRIVDEVTDKYARVKGISQNELSDLADDLRMHWRRIKRAWNKGGEIT